MQRVDILNLEWSAYRSRDRDAASLVCNYLRNSGKIVVEGSIHNWMYLIHKHRPKLLFLCNSIGSKVNYSVVKYAHFKNIPIVTLASEGNFVNDPQKIEQMIWGWNSDKKLYENLNLQWSIRSLNLIYDVYPNLKNKIKVSGAVGFDKYQILRRAEKVDVLSRYGKEKYNKIIGFACFTFGSARKGGRNYDEWLRIYGEEALMRFDKDSYLQNEILIKIVDIHKDILFLIKEHPGNTEGDKGSGIVGLRNKDNVLIIQDEESIVDCIAISDIWLSYESTTALEAWLYNVPTGLINPLGRDFVRANVHLGSPNFNNTSDLSEAIAQFYRDKRLPGFEEREPHRKRIIEETIQWKDGLNHVRAGNLILSVLSSSDEFIEPSFSFLEKCRILKGNLYWEYAEVLYKVFRQERFNELSKYKSMFSPGELDKVISYLYHEQMAFYSSRGLTPDILSKVVCS